jgi:hypothetical protein
VDVFFVISGLFSSLASCLRDGGTEHGGFNILYVSTPRTRAPHFPSADSGVVPSPLAAGLVRGCSLRVRAAREKALPPRAAGVRGEMLQFWREGRDYTIALAEPRNPAVAPVVRSQ